MTDRELLEAAAKAAGIVLSAVIVWDEMDQCIWRHEPDCDGVSGYWNPLVDDGDALRLAVKLGLSYMLILNVGRTGASVEFDDNPAAALERHGNGPYAATRRAIVRAAAAIGATA